MGNRNFSFYLRIFFYKEFEAEKYEFDELT